MFRSQGRSLGRSDKMEVLRLYKTDLVVPAPCGRRIVYYEPTEDTTYIKDRCGDWTQYDVGRGWTKIKETRLAIIKDRTHRNVTQI